jgi:hypothetical protein
MATTQPLSGKLALVTGASKGIGAATALTLASLGARVVINYSSDPAPADALVEKIGRANALAIKADVSSVAEIERLVQETVAWGGQIDILIPNAAIALMRTVEQTTEEDFTRTMDLNVKGPYFLCQVCRWSLRLVDCYYSLPYHTTPHHTTSHRKQENKTNAQQTNTPPLESIPAPLLNSPHNPPLDLPLRLINHHAQLRPLRDIQGRNRANGARARQGLWTAQHHGQLRGTGPDGHGAVLPGQERRAGGQDCGGESVWEDRGAARDCERHGVFGW